MPGSGRFGLLAPGCLAARGAIAPAQARTKPAPPRVETRLPVAWSGGFTGVQARRAVPGSQAIVQGAAFETSRIADAASAPLVEVDRSTGPLD